MATWTAPTTRSTGFLITASVWNTDIVENLKYLKDSPVFDGDVTVGDDLFMSSGGVINFDSGDVTITHSTNALSFNGASSGYSFDADLKLSQGEYLEVGALVGTWGGRIGRSATNDIVIGVTGTTATAGLYIITSAGQSIAEFYGDKSVSFTGTVKTASTVSVGGAMPAATGAGITFPAAASASSDANTLDDYEEGNWTATLAGSTTNPTTPVQVTGQYVKIGRVVHVQVNIANVNTAGAAGNVTVTGLPFTIANLAGPMGAAYGSGWNFNGGTAVWALGGANTATVSFYTDGGAFNALLHNGNNNMYLYFSLTYFV
jgi:hypothetical protein